MVFAYIKSNIHTYIVRNTYIHLFFFFFYEIKIQNPINFLIIKFKERNSRLRYKNIYIILMFNIKNKKIKLNNIDFNNLCYIY